VDDADFDADALVAAARLLDDPAGHLAMSAAARGAASPGAADAVARLVLAAAMRVAYPPSAEIARLAAGGAGPVGSPNAGGEATTAGGGAAPGTGALGG
jgi:hypothetical protein